MDRIIKFRGFSVLFNKWIYGVGLKYDRKGKPFIYVDTGWYEVYEGSEGQFTGLISVNDEDIYENDIVNCFTSYRSVVVFKNSGFCLETNGTYDWIGVVYGNMEVIGNTFEHQHLLEGVK